MAAPAGGTDAAGASRAGTGPAEGAGTTAPPAPRVPAAHNPSVAPHPTDLLPRARPALEALARCAGYVRGSIGRSTDDPQAWVLVTEWVNVGSYRRALGKYDVKLHAVPTLGRAIDEPSAYEDAEPGAELNVRSTRST